MEPYFKRFLFKIGSKPRGEYVYTKERISVFGALGVNDFYFEITEEYCNWQTWLIFITNLLKKYGKIVIIIDGAKYHFEKEHVQKFYAENKENLIIFQLPAYSPELNPIEQYWRYVKEHLANTSWLIKKEFERNLVYGLKNCFKPKLYDYYLR